MDEVTYNPGIDASVTLDAIDRHILYLLQSNGRMTNTALAEAVGLTATPMLQRMKKAAWRHHQVRCDR
jgi:DNA-binding Lrp family transcriptional regulator